MKAKRHSCFLAFLLLAAGASGAGHSSIFVADTWPIPANEIDAHVLAVLREQAIEPARPCSDEVFLRRVYLDVIGVLPEPREVRAFLDNRDPDKRRATIDRLLKREEFADYWTMKWCDLLRVKAEYPINLWPNGVQAYYRWIHDAVRKNVPYDEFARELLTSSGSNFRTPAVNFYCAVQGKEPAAIAGAVARVFLGARIDSWSGDRRKGFEAFFSRVAYKGTAEWKETIVHPDRSPSGPVEASFPDGGTVVIPSGTDPRRVFADWLTDRNNPLLARCVVNRIWYWLMGRGIIHEPDDIRSGNPPVNPALLGYLATELVKTDYDLRHIYRLILNSRTYQQASIPRSDSPRAEAMFACYPVRRLDAEVLIDALSQITGVGEDYSSRIPEPYTFIPEAQRSVCLADASITSPFLEMFGRPSRDTGLLSERSSDPTDKQRLHLLNSSHIQEKINNGRRLWVGLLQKRGRPREAIEHIYLTILSRNPRPSELWSVTRYFRTPGLERKEMVADLVWALINTKEFLYRH